MAAFGVHFGTTSACLAVYKDGKTDVVANDLGDRTTPCVVAYTDLDQTVGVAAKQGSIRNTANTISFVKSVLGRSWVDPVSQEYIKKSQVKIENKNGDLVFVVDFKGDVFNATPKDVATAIYKRMKETASSHGDGDIHDSVLAVPSQFSEEQRKAFEKCASHAGFSVLRTLNESIAALLAYDLGQMDNTLQCNVLVYRLGGDSTDVSIVHLQGGLYRILGNTSSRDVAGSKFTNVLADYLAQEFFKKYKLDVKESRRSVNKLRMATEVCKHTLSTLENAQVSIDSLHEGVDFHSSVSRARFESLCGNLIQKCVALIDDVCAKANVSSSDIEKVIVCGGGAKPRLVQKAISEYLSNAEVYNSIPPDEVIAIGAAKQAAILTGSNDSELHSGENEIECLSKTVCIKGVNANKEPVLYPIFQEMTPFPARRQEVMNLSPHQTSMEMDICECTDIENPDTAKCLAKIVMKDLPEKACISVTFHLRSEGSLHVTCREEASQAVEQVTIDVCS
uniref:Heat shock 70 kDa protein 14-like n=1 Tax=Crassostrea virginica TaxID=6565 RepID=A0A8B8B184_CRAVI|nr:heat shock 70 kDa protein 14-like [Crassostrea virginica]